MASVALETVLLSLASDPAVMLALDVPELQDSDESFGEVRSYANGRQRSVSRAGSRRTIPLEPDWMTTTEVETLRGWRKLPLLMREPRGRKVFCVFFGFDSSPYIVNDYAKVSFSLTEISYSEAV